MTDRANVWIVRVAAHLLRRAPRRHEDAEGVDDPKERPGVGVAHASHVGLAAELGEQGVDQRRLARGRIVLRHHEIEHQQSRRIPAGVDAREPVEGVDQQARADEQHRGHDHLRHDQHAAGARIAATGAALSTGAAVVHHLRVIDPRHPERRQRADDERGDHRQSHRQSEQASIDADLMQPRQHRRAAKRELKHSLRVRRREFAEQVDEPDRQQRAEHAADRGEHQALGDELAEDASTAGADGQAHRDLPLACRAARQQQAGDVRAHDQQHRADGDRDHAKRGTARGDHLLLDAFNREAPLTGRQRSRQRSRRGLRAQPLADRIGLVGRGLDGRALSAAARWRRQTTCGPATLP